MSNNTHKNTTIRQKQIIEAARTVVVKYGSENVTIKRIANEVGFSEAAIYRHFKSKRDVLTGLANYVIQELLQDLSKPERSSTDGLETIEIMLDNHIKAIEHRKGASFQVIAEILSFGDRKLSKKVYAGLEEYISRLEELINTAFPNKCAKSGSVDSNSAAFILFGMVQGLVNVWALSNYGFDLKDKYNELWGCFVNGILFDYNDSGSDH
jgi:AcrR family transcriptional regulator